MLLTLGFGVWVFLWDCVVWLNGCGFNYWVGFVWVVLGWVAVVLDCWLCVVWFLSVGGLLYSVSFCLLRLLIKWWVFRFVVCYLFIASYGSLFLLLWFGVLVGYEFVFEFVLCVFFVFA